jgi:hypothetical protein
MAMGNNTMEVSTGVWVKRLRTGLRSTGSKEMIWDESESLGEGYRQYTMIWKKGLVGTHPPA